MTEQPRVPSGVPSGGQYAASQRLESGVELRPVDGSFMYPPTFRSAAAVVDFWSRVEIPDEVLARCQQVYTTNWQFVAEEWAPHAWRMHGSKNWDRANPAPDPADVGATADWEGRKRAAQADYEDSLAERLRLRPEMLNRKDLRPLVRAAGMFLSSAEVDPAERPSIYDHPVELATGTVPVREAMVETGFAGLAARFINPEVYDADGDGRIDPPVAPAAGASEFDWAKHRQIVEETVASALAKHEKNLDRVFDEFHDNIGRVGQVVIDVSDTGRGR